MPHSKELQLSENPSLDATAEALSNLSYDALADFFLKLAMYINDDGIDDSEAGRIKLAKYLWEASGFLQNVSWAIENAWRVCKPYMNEP